jgi:hypothetical protein
MLYQVEIALHATVNAVRGQFQQEDEEVPRALPSI